MSESTHSGRCLPPARDAERGSAYLFVLLGLLVLTIIGLSLVVVTQTEAQIGGAEKSAARILFGAESGLHAQVGLHFLELDPLENQFTLDTNAIKTIVSAQDIETIEETVNVSPFYPIYAGPCALCSVNFQGEQRYWVNNYVVNAQASRYAAGGCAEIPQAQKLLSEMFMIQPEPLQGGGVDKSIRTYDPSLISVPDPCDKGLLEIVY
jgi:hypothetical protein